MTTYAQRQVYGSQVQVGSDYTTDIAAGQFSSAIGTWDNSSDGTVPHAPSALATLEIGDFGAAPVLNEVFELWGVRQNTQSTNDDTGDPSGADINSAEHYCNFELEDVDALQRITREISVYGCREIKFFIRNSSSQTGNFDSGAPLKLYIWPFAPAVVV